MSLTQDLMYILLIVYITHQVPPNQLIFLMEILPIIHPQVHHLIHTIIFIPIRSRVFLIKNIHFCRQRCPVMNIIHRHQTIEFFSFYSFLCVSFFSFGRLFCSFADLKDRLCLFCFRQVKTFTEI